MAKFPKVTASVALLLFQILLIILFALFVEYDPAGGANNRAFYPAFQDVHVMIFVGFGYLMTFLDRYSFSALGYNMLISAVVIQWSMLLNSWVAKAVHGEDDPHKVQVNVQNMITSDFTAGAVLITFGAVIGKVSRLQLLIIGIIECVFFAINESILIHKLYISDVGGSIVIHAFGAYFGLGVSLIVGLGNKAARSDNDKAGASSPHSELFAMIGSLFLWMYWPSFNGAMLGEKPFQQNRAFINTYISLAAACVATFVVSSLVDKKGKIDMVHIENATLAGGVAIGSCADLAIQPWGAMLIGTLAGIISVLGYAFITPALTKLGIHDTCGVNNLHGIPGLMSGIFAAIAAVAVPEDEYEPTGIFSLYPKRMTGRSASKQGGYQMAGVMVGICLALVGGVVAGLAAKWLDQPAEEELYDDKAFWHVPGASEPDNSVEMNGKSNDASEIKA